MQSTIEPGSQICSFAAATRAHAGEYEAALQNKRMKCSHKLRTVAHH